MENKENRNNVTSSTSMDEVEISLDKMSFAPGENRYLNEYAHIGETVDFFEELSDGGERNEIIKEQLKGDNK